MGTATTAFTDAVKTVRANPLVIAVTTLVWIVGIVLTGVLGVIPVLGQLAAQPVGATISAGIIGVIGYGIHTETTLDYGQFRSILSERGTTMFAVALAEAAVYLGLTIAAVIVGALVFGIGTAAVGVTTQGPSNPLEGGVGIIVMILFAVFALAYTTVFILFQFLNTAVILGGDDIRGAFRTSVTLVRTSPVSVIGYTLLRVGIGIGILGLLVAIAAGGSAALGDTAGGTLAGVSVLVLGPVGVTLYYVYHAQYYLALPAAPVNTHT